MYLVQLTLGTQQELVAVDSIERTVDGLLMKRSAALAIELAFEAAVTGGVFATREQVEAKVIAHTTGDGLVIPRTK